MRQLITASAQTEIFPPKLAAAPRWYAKNPASPSTLARSRPVLPPQPIKGAGDGTNKSQKNVVNKKGPHTPQRTAPPLYEPAC